jgi:hypothetical protein
MPLPLVQDQGLSPACALRVVWRRGWHSRLIVHVCRLALCRLLPKPAPVIAWLSVPTLAWARSITPRLNARAMTGMRFCHLRCVIPTTCQTCRARAGDGFERYPQILQGSYKSKLAEIRQGLKPHAREIAMLGVRYLLAGRSVASVDVAPFYVRNKVALTMKERR